MLKKLALAGLVSAFAFAAPAHAIEIIDFEEYADGKFISGTKTAQGVSVSGLSSSGLPAIGFDTTIDHPGDPGGNDDDLEAPFGGPGPANPGTIMVFPENDPDQSCAGGFCNTPANDDVASGTVTFDFSTVAGYQENLGVTVFDMAYFDEEVGEAITVEFFNKDGVSLGVFDTTAVGDGNSGIRTFDAGVSFVETMAVTWNNTSGGIDQIKFLTAVPEPSTWVMMILGFGFVALRLQRKNRKAVATA